MIIFYCGCFRDYGGLYGGGRWCVGGDWGDCGDCGYCDWFLKFFLIELFFIVFVGGLLLDIV